MSSRKLSSQFVKSVLTTGAKLKHPHSFKATTVGSSTGPYNHSLNVTIENSENRHQQQNGKKNKYQLHSSKMILEPLTTSNSVNQGLMTKLDSSGSGPMQAHQRGIKGKTHLSNKQNESKFLQEKDGSYVMLPSTTASQNTKSFAEKVKKSARGTPGVSQLTCS